jgi:subtilase family serine protease
MMKAYWCTVAALVILAGALPVAGENQPGNLAGSRTAPRQIVQPVNDLKLVTLAGNTHPQASAQFDRGPVPDGMVLDHLLLQLKRSPERERVLAELIDELHNPRSANFHRWLTARDFGERFGPAADDISTVASWLLSHGLQVNLVYPSGMVIDVTATAGQIREAFHTEIHYYDVGGKRHIANASDPRIPAALQPVIEGFAALHDFRPSAHMRRHFSFGFQGFEFYELGPQDFATIYNLNPLWQASSPIRGAGQTIVVLEDSDMNASDWTTFRSAFGLASYAGKLTQIHPEPRTGTQNCTDPGLTYDESEAALDAEWSGAVAPDAAIELASCRSTRTTFADLIAGHNLLNSSAPPAIMSDSYGGCESGYGTSGNAAYRKLWQQAVVEGTSVFVAAGDEGAAECDAGLHYATQGIAVDGTASTPYDVAVGGTDFTDYVDGTTSEYWTNTNGFGGETALSYVPEMTYNDSCASSVLFSFEGYSSGGAFCNSQSGQSDLWVAGGSGGPSAVYKRPAWQAAVYGTVNDGWRNLPDVSLFAGDGFYTHAYVYCMSDTNQGGLPCEYSNSKDAYYNSAGGTSFSSPAFAGIQALVNQKTGSRQGNPNYVLYSLAAAEYGSNSNPNLGNLSACNTSNGKAIGAACVFYDVTTGDNDQPCKGTDDCYTTSGATYGVLSTSSTSLNVAYPSKGGWDFATGLGSVNIANLVDSWSSAADLAVPAGSQ